MALDKNHIKKISLKAGKILFWLVLVSGLIYSIRWVHAESGKTRCSRIDVRITNGDALGFLDREQIIRLVLPDGDEKSITSRYVADIPVDSLERVLVQDRWIKSAQVFTDMNGVIHIHITQREPILSVINIRNERYYIDREGLKMPVSAAYTAHVPVATGFITEGYESTDSVATHALKGLVKIATYVDKEAFWKAQIEQIFVNAGSELILIPKVGDHQIVFGTTEDLEEKFDKLLVFYREALPRVGWSTYRQIDVRFKNQVVTKKK